MTVTPVSSFPDVKIIEPDVFGDERGFFFESFNARTYESWGMPSVFLQDNVSHSKKGILRGLHFQNPGAQGKLVQVLRGRVLDVIVDIRKRSPSFGRWVGVELSEENKKQLWVPQGFAHGYVVLSEEATFFYKVTDYYRPESEHSLLWNDPEVGVAWPIAEPILSRKDASAKTLKELLPNLPDF